MYKSSKSSTPRLKSQRERAREEYEGSGEDGIFHSRRDAEMVKSGERGRGRLSMMGWIYGLTAGFEWAFARTYRAIYRLSGEKEETTFDRIVLAL